MLKALAPLAAAIPMAALSAGTAGAAVAHPTTPTPQYSASTSTHVPSHRIHGSHPMLMVPVAPAPATPAAPGTAPIPTPTPSVGAPGSFAVYAGYMDDHHHGSTKPKPSPWQGDPNIVFAGQSDTAAGGWDTSAVRVDNLSSAPETVTVTVDIGAKHFALWGTQTIPPGESLILTQMGSDTFDGSDTNPAGEYGADPVLCGTAVRATVPVVHLTVDGVATDVQDTRQVLNTGGVDAAGCPATGFRADESEPWTRL